MNTNTLFALATLTLLPARHAVAQPGIPPHETLGRGVVALPSQSGKGNFVSWRYLGTDAEATTFDVLRGSTVIARDLATATCYTDAAGTSSSRYTVVTKVGGKEVSRSAAITPWTDIYRTLQLSLPATGYTPNDCSVGDVDGDGEYELFVKWDPSDSKDNSQSGKTSNVYIDCYRLDGTQLWRIDLGCNIRAGAHYTQFLVYDFDLDGHAELICKTAPGSTDGTGSYVSLAATDADIAGATDNSTDYRNSSGYVLSGPEYLSVFDGQTGRALHTIYYRPNRAGDTAGGGAPSGSSSSFWGDSYGNRCDRFLAAVAYLDGPTARPSAVMCRGYYTKAYVWAVDFDGQQLATKWVHASTSKTSVTVTDAQGSSKTYSHSSPTSGSGSATLYGNGNHNLSVADVDGDGRDEIVYGSAAVDHDGRLLYATGFGHGDAIHLSDLMPDRPGLELFQVHEDKGTYSWDLHDAATGEVLLCGGNSGVDNGRGLAADLIGDSRGFEFCSTDDRSLRSAVTGESVSSVSTSVNFRIYWDGDLHDELLDDKKLEKVADTGVSRLLTLYNYGASQDCNSTKHTPNLMCDLFGDWREEIIYYDANDPSVLNIFTTNVPTTYRVPTLMHDHVYRLGVAWQQTAYNQPPHLGYYLPDLFAETAGDVTPESEFVSIYKQDYEQATDASSWVSPNAQDRIWLATDDTRYIRFEGHATLNSRSGYTLFTAGGLERYVLTFDLRLAAGTKDATEFAVMAQGGTYTGRNLDNKYYTDLNGGAHYLLDLNAGAYSTTWTINQNAAETAVIPADSWCHVRLDVDGKNRTVAYRITSRTWGNVLATGTYTLPDATSHELAGLYCLCGRYSSRMAVDNVCVAHDPNATECTYLYTQDYEQATDASAWNSPNASANLSLQTDATKYILFQGNASTNTRYCYSTFSVPALEAYSSYYADVDFALTPGNREGSEFAVCTSTGTFTGPNSWTNYRDNNAGAHYLLDLTSSNDARTTYVVNGDAATTVELPSGEWLTAHLEVDTEARSVAYTLRRRSDQAVLATGTYTLPQSSGTAVGGLYYLAGRYNCAARVDNIRVYVETPIATAIDDITSTWQPSTLPVAQAPSPLTHPTARDLSGRAVRTMRRGIYIVGRRKIAIR